MKTERLVVHRVETGTIQKRLPDITLSRFPIISLKGAMEEAPHMGKWVAGIPLDHTYPCSQMDRHSRNRWMILSSRWLSVPGSTMS